MADVEAAGIPENSLNVSQYCYEPLSGPSNIRVIHVLKTKHRVECGIEEIECLEGGYHALSYAWGSSGKPFTAFICDNDGTASGYVSLTQNLYDALCDIRDCSEISTKVFWIDQISINQEGSVEKNHQVSMMHQIYQNAVSVIVYAGPSDQTTKEETGIRLALQLHDGLQFSYDKIQDNIYDQSIAIEASLPLELTTHEFKHWSEKSMHKYESQGWKWLFDITYSDRIERLWVIYQAHSGDIVC
jgi:hypothetical protein